MLRLRYGSATVAEPGEASLRQLFWLSSGLRRSQSLFLGRYKIAQEVTGMKEPEPRAQTNGPLGLFLAPLGYC